MPYKVALIFNFCMLIPITLIGAFYPNVGQILGILGALSGLFGMYILPISTSLKRWTVMIRNPGLARALDHNHIKSVDDGLTSPKIVVDRQSQKSKSFAHSRINKSDNASYLDRTSGGDTSLLSPEAQDRSDSI